MRLAATFGGKDYYVDWDSDVPPTQDQLSAIARQVKLQSSGEKAGASGIQSLLGELGRQYGYQAPVDQPKAVKRANNMAPLPDKIRGLAEAIASGHPEPQIAKKKAQSLLDIAAQPKTPQYGWYSPSQARGYEASKQAAIEATTPQPSDMAFIRQGIQDKAAQFTEAANSAISTLNPMGSIPVVGPAISGVQRGVASLLNPYGLAEMGGQIGDAVQAGPQEAIRQVGEMVTPIMKGILQPTSIENFAESATQGYLLLEGARHLPSQVASKIAGIKKALSTPKAAAMLEQAKSSVPGFEIPDIPKAETKAAPQTDWDAHEAQLRTQLEKIYDKDHAANLASLMRTVDENQFNQYGVAPKPVEFVKGEKAPKVQKTPKTEITPESIAETKTTSEPKYKPSEKYHQPIPEVKAINPKRLINLNTDKEVSRVSADVANAMDFSQPVEASLFADGTIGITDGHHRVAAAKQLGLASIPVKLRGINAKGKVIQGLIRESESLVGKGATRKDVASHVKNADAPVIEAKAAEPATPTAKNSEANVAQNAAAKEPWQMTAEEIRRGGTKPQKPGTPKYYESLPDYSLAKLTQTDPHAVPEALKRAKDLGFRSPTQWVTAVNKADDVLRSAHKDYVRNALSEGKPVPPAVVDEFLSSGGKLPEKGLHPDLAAKYQSTKDVGTTQSPKEVKPNGQEVKTEAASGRQEGVLSEIRAKGREVASNRAPFWQQRAKPGGEIGPNGEHYKGGQFIARFPETVKGAGRKAQSLGDSANKANITPKGTAVLDPPGAGTTARPVDSSRWYGGKLERNTTLRVHPGSHEPWTVADIASIESGIKKWNALVDLADKGGDGVEWHPTKKSEGKILVDIRKHPEWAGAQDIARYIADGERIPTELIPSAKKVLKGIDVDEYHRLLDWADKRTTSLSQQNNAKVDIGPDKAVVTILKEKPDASQAVHEMAHVWRRQAFEGKTETSLADQKVLNEWVGSNDGNWTTAHEERFARGFERYLTTGKAPNLKVKPVFERIKGWMQQVYRNISRSPIKAEVPDHITEVFDRWLGGKEDIPVGETPKATTTAHADIDAIRTVVGWDPRESTPEKISQWGEEAKALKGKEATIADEITAKPRQATKAEEVALGNRLVKLLDERDKAKASGNAQAFDLADAEANKIADALDVSGSEWGRQGVARQIVLNGSYDDFSLKRRAVKAKGEDLTKVEAAKVQELSDRVAELERKLLSALAERRGVPRADKTIIGRRKSALSKISELTGKDVLYQASFDQMQALREVARTYVEEGQYKLDDVVASLKKHNLPFDDAELMTAARDAIGTESRLANRGRTFGEDIMQAGQWATKDPEIAKMRAQLEIAKMEADAEVRSMQPKDKLHMAIQEGAGAIRAVKLAFDLGAMLRQGFMGLIHNPKMWGKAQVKGAEAMLGHHGMTAKEFETHTMLGIMEREIDGRYMAPIRKRAELQLSNHLNPEEAYMAQWIKKIPGLGKYYEGTERYQATMLNVLRADMFDQFAAKFPGATDAELKQWGSYVNNAIGRSNIKAVNAAAQLVFTSPRWLMSRIGLLSDVAKALPTMHKSVASRAIVLEAAKAAATVYGGLKLLEMAGMKVNWDPQSSDFLKARDGDTVFDFTAAEGRTIRTFMRVAMGNPVVDEVGRFLGNSVSPGITVPYQLATAAAGKPKGLTGREEPIDLGTFGPLLGQQFYQQIQKDGWTGALKSLPEFVGISSQQYPEKKPTSRK